MYSRVLKFIHFFDDNNKPLVGAKIEVDKLSKIVTTFSKIMEVMNEKKLFFINSFLEKAKEVMRKLSFTPTEGLRKLIIQRRPGYNVIQNKRATIDKGEKIPRSTGVVPEERTNDPLPKRKEIIREQAPQIEEYSPTHSPLQLGDEQGIHLE